MWDSHERCSTSIIPPHIWVRLKIMFLKLFKNTKELMVLQVLKSHRQRVIAELMLSFHSHKQRVLGALNSLAKGDEEFVKKIPKGGKIDLVSFYLKSVSLSHFWSFCSQHIYNFGLFLEKAIIVSFRLVSSFSNDSFSAFSASLSSFSSTGTSARTGKEKSFDRW